MADRAMLILLSVLFGVAMAILGSVMLGVFMYEYTTVHWLIFAIVTTTAALWMIKLNEDFEERPFNYWGMLVFCIFAEVLIAMLIAVLTLVY